MLGRRIPVGGALSVTLDGAMQRHARSQLPRAPAEERNEARPRGRPREKWGDAIEKAHLRAGTQGLSGWSSAGSCARAQVGWSIRPSQWPCGEGRVKVRLSPAEEPVGVGFLEQVGSTRNQRQEGVPRAGECRGPGEGRGGCSCPQSPHRTSGEGSVMFSTIFKNCARNASAQARG